MLLEHNDALEFGDSKTNLVLHNDSFGLAFRCHLRDNEVSSHARALAESNAFSECSIGFSYEPHDAEIRTISKTDVLFVNKGSIHEISFVKAGAVKQTHAVIADADKCEPLWSDCKSLKFELDNKYTELQRTLRKLIT
jgi:HK97 family phage prohead protease